MLATPVIISSTTEDSKKRVSIDDVVRVGPS
jgi:hypothetical protein